MCLKFRNVKSFALCRSFGYVDSGEGDSGIFSEKFLGFRKAYSRVSEVTVRRLDLAMYAVEPLFELKLVVRWTAIVLENVG